MAVDLGLYYMHELGRPSVYQICKPRRLNVRDWTPSIPRSFFFHFEHSFFSDMNHFHEGGISDCEILANSVKVLMARVERWISMEVELGVSPRWELELQSFFRGKYSIML